MGIRERKERTKLKVREDILHAALTIVKTEGVQALSMRKIADSIEYAVPIIYEHFENKDAILIELCRQGYATMVKQIAHNHKEDASPRARLENIVKAMWGFATKEPELYQLMYSVGLGCNNVQQTFPELVTFRQLVWEGIGGLDAKGKKATDQLQCRYLSFISMLHGLVSTNYFLKDIDPATNKKVLKDFIDNMVH
ncbi:TetR/AcrR family transcriptional regulator [Paraflavitalea pollutisoli]|uniref:TetR/AcrR family transcriptional regulator n=1 Tax=Paraflavitalea pollutisoli TaxID=3034143 RepID=UPI0023EAB4FC|nr:TetR/AcrR family transcriptional regulator [Paraflavitalea sp. H1-2-19X]